MICECVLFISAGVDGTAAAVTAADVVHTVGMDAFCACATKRKTPNIVYLSLNY